MKIKKISDKLAISPQAFYEHLKGGKHGDNRRITTIILYRFLLNCNEDTLDFLLNNDNFNAKERIKSDILAQKDSAEAWYE